jgi:CBS domain-containing protein
MRVSDLMSTPVETTSPTDLLETARTRMRQARIRHLVVVEGRRVVGVLSERDIGPPSMALSYSDATVVERMTPSPVTIPAQATLSQAANVLRGRTIGCLPVVDGPKLVGILTTTDLLELVGRQASRLPGAGRPRPVRKARRTPRATARR